MQRVRALYGMEVLEAVEEVFLDSFFGPGFNV